MGGNLKAYAAGHRLIPPIRRCHRSGRPKWLYYRPCRLLFWSLVWMGVPRLSLNMTVMRRHEGDVRVASAAGLKT